MRGAALKRSTAIVTAVAALAAVALAAHPAHAGSLKAVPGESKRSGPGTLFDYVVKVERGIRIKREQFADMVQEILFSDRSWTGTREVAFERVRRGANTKIILARPHTVDRLCAPLDTNGTYSCSIGERVVLNHRRWVRTVDHWTSSRPNYRRMLVNHEVGHRIGHGHRSCPGSDKKAFVMQQQSISLDGCRANWWPRKPELRATKRMYSASAVKGSPGFVD
jgi:hypothetical protein